MKQNPRLRSLSLSIIACSLLSALPSCAGAPPNDPKLDQAYSDYDSASHDSAVQQAAPEQLQKASSELAKAEELLKNGAPTSEVHHYAYLARERVAIAQQKSETNAIQKKINLSGTQRDKAILDAKQQKINQLGAQVSQQKSDAQTASEKLKQDKAQRDKAILDAKQQKILSLREKLSNLKAKETNRGLVLTLGSVLFDLNKSTLKTGATKNLDKLSEFMKNDPKRNVMIEGYTDSTGKPEYNKRLSIRRAKAVRNTLVNDGINPQRIVTKGYGSHYSLATNKTAEGRQENRRVEIVISDEHGKFPKNR